MNAFPFIFLILLLHSAVASLPQPVNLRMESLNFQHVLHWDPGPGSPPGTQFWIYRRVGVRIVLKMLSQEPVNSTSFKLKLKPHNRHELVVEASYNNTKSPRSTITFQPIKETVIGPPLLSVAGCGTCIQGNISMPDLDPYTKNHSIYYDFSYTVWWRKGNGGEIQKLETQSKNFNLSNLEKDVEYCIQVLPNCRTNKNTQPTGWTCTFTSIPEPDYGLLVLVVVTAVLIVSLTGLMTGIFCLYYTGFLCKLKEMPAALMVILRQSYVLTLSTTDINRVAIIPQTVKPRNRPATSPSPSAAGDASSEDEDSDEEAAVKLYMDRNAELSTGSGSADSSGNNDVMKGDFMKVESNQYEAKAETIFIHEKDQSGQEDSTTQLEEIKIETLEFSGDVNLFSVTLASMAACEEDEVEEDQDSGSSSMDFLRTYTLKPLRQMDSERERDDGMRPSESGQDGSSTECWMDEEKEEEEEEEEEEKEEEEEEEEFSGYLTNK